MSKTIAGLSSSTGSYTAGVIHDAYLRMMLGKRLDAFGKELAMACCIAPLKRGDRVRIKEGYEDAGTDGFYVGKANYEAGKVIVSFPSCIDRKPFVGNALLAEAIEAYPYSREERIVRAIEDYDTGLPEDDDFGPLDAEAANLLFAILDAGV